MGHHLHMADGDELAAFLRSRREQLKPEDVGLPTSRHRRTPGLRRQELATLAGVSVEYLERLEQGRDTNPSVGILAALADTLRLSDDDKRHLAMLAMKRQSGELLPRPRPIGDEPRPSLRTLLDCLDPTPACLLGPIYDVIEWNKSWETMARPMGLLDHSPPNLIRHHFINPKARRSFLDLDWEATADELVGWLRSAQTEWGPDDDFRALIDELCALPAFASRWASHPVAQRRPGAMRICHPDAGILNITLEILLVGEANQWLQMWLPRDEQTKSAMQNVIAGPLLGS
jgi:transcriptional regulator with XRE-family HTH domain